MSQREKKITGSLSFIYFLKITHTHTHTHRATEQTNKEPKTTQQQQKLNKTNHTTPHQDNTFKLG